MTARGQILMLTCRPLEEYGLPFEGTVGIVADQNRLLYAKYDDGTTVPLGTGVSTTYVYPAAPVVTDTAEIPPSTDGHANIYIYNNTFYFTDSDGNVTAGGSGVYQPLDPTLTALAAFNTNGILCQTAADTFAGRTLTAPAAGLTITNPAGIAGNPTFALANDLAAVEGLAAAGMAARTGSDAWAVRTITGTANEVTITNGDGSAGNPTVSLPTALTFSGKTITGGSITPEATPTTAAIGYLGSPQIGTQTDYTLTMADAGKHYYHTSATPHTLTIPANASVAFPVGTIIMGFNESGAGDLTIAITTDTLRWSSSTGSRTIAANGSFSLTKVTATLWRLTGDGIS